MIILPSLEIVPAKYNTSTNTLLSQIPIDGTGDFTVTRATSPTTGQSTRVNALGLIELVPDNVPRLDYPLGGAVNGCPALLVEPAATNLFQRSEEFNNAYWTPSNVTPTPNSTGTLDPFGGNNAELITKTSAVNTVAGISRNAPFSATGTHTLSVFIKSSVGNSVLLRMDSVNNTANTAFTFSTKTFSNSGANFISSSFQEFSNGWFRLSLTASVQSTLWNVDVIQLFSNPTNDAFWIFGAQLEANSVPTSYIPTVASGITRAADVITDTTASGVIGQTEGTIYLEVEAPNSNQQVFRIRSGATNSLHIYKIGGNFYRASINGSVGGEVDLTDVSVRSGFVKIALGYKSGQSALVINGGNPITSAASFTFSVALDSVNFLGGYQVVLPFRIRAAALYPTRLTDTQLALLTSPYTSYSSMASALSYTLG